MKTVLMIASSLLLVGIAHAQEYNDTAMVLDARPHYEQVSVPYQECWNETRQEVRPQRGYEPNSNLGGAILGGVVGGVLGHQVGGGHGKDVATVGGAIAGTVIGSRMQSGNAERYQEPQEDTRTVQRCAQRERREDHLTGYDVTYDYKGATYHALLPENPGRRLPVHVTMDVSPR
ncbi:MAG: glycine zipper 2TM domain-containing protein [Formivibrio sp.]|nr:glycine zipper 2TM domain-containing protein [Formivibrio sp.]